MGFADPFALGFGALAGVLVLLYFWERRRRHVPVPALFLWQGLREDTVQVERFRPDLLFFLQLLALLCLVAGLAKPYGLGASATGAGRRHVFVLDATASMQAREAGGSRWTLARDRVREEIDALPEGDEVMVVTAADTPESAVAFTRDRAEAQRILERLQPVDTGGDLRVALAFAENARSRSDRPTRVRVYTDRPQDTLPPALRGNVDFEQVGRSADNVAVESLVVHQGRFQAPASAAVEVRLRNFSGREQHGLLTVELEQASVLRTGFTLPPNGTRGFRVDGLPGPGRVTARLGIDDALAIDNTASAWVRPVQAGRLHVVSASPDLARTLAGIASGTPGLEVSASAPDAMEPLPAADLFLFDGTSPPSAPAANALFVYPPPGNPSCDIAGDAADTDILDWNPGHPAVGPQRPANPRPFPRARVLAARPGDEPLLVSRNDKGEFPLALARDSGGRRTVCLGFELGATDLLGSDGMGMLLFFLNTLGWLAPTQPQSVVLPTGQTFAWPDDAAREMDVVEPSGATRVVRGSPPALTPRRAGAYRLSSGGQERTLLAVFANAAESDLAVTPATGTASAVGVETSRHGRPEDVRLPPSDFGRILYLLAFALLVLEWSIGARRA